jgi:hypothetical protein
VEIFRIETLDADGQMISAPKMKQDFCLKIYFKFHKSGTYTIAMAFWNANGVLLGRVDAPDKMLWMTGDEEDICTLTVKVKNVFLAGKHKLLVSARDKCDVLTDQVDNIFFEVQPLLSGEGAVRHYGVVQISSEWDAPVKLTAKYSSRS